MRYYHYEGSIITGDYSCPQPDAIDGQGNIVKGVVTVPLPDNHPDVIIYRAIQNPPPADEVKKKDV